MDDSSSQVEAEAILAYLTEEGFCREKAVILVANKTDLVRNRTITREGLGLFKIFTFPIYSFGGQFVHRNEALPYLLLTTDCFIEEIYIFLLFNLKFLFFLRGLVLRVLHMCEAGHLLAD